MQIYDTHDDMYKKEYRPANDESSTQVAWALIRNPRPLVHELGSISLETVRKMLYKLYVHNYEAPEGFIFGRDVLLLSIVIGDDFHRKTKPFIEMLKSLEVFEGAGAYYVVIDTSLDLPTLHAGAHLEDGLDTAITIAALVQEQAPLAEDGLDRFARCVATYRSLAQERTNKMYNDMDFEYQIYIEYGENEKHWKVPQHALDKEKVALFQERYELSQERYEPSKKMIEEAWGLVFHRHRDKRLKQIVDELLELSVMVEDAYMIKVWGYRSSTLAKLVHLQESDGQA